MQPEVVVSLSLPPPSPPPLLEALPPQPITKLSYVKPVLLKKKDVPRVLKAKSSITMRVKMTEGPVLKS